MNRFRNVMTNEMVAEAVAPGVDRKGAITNSWYIKMGFCGFNSPTNNRFGYQSKRAAENAVLRYQNR